MDMIVLTDPGFHSSEGDPPNRKVCPKGTWNVRMVKEGVENEPGAKKRFEDLAAQLWQVESERRKFTEDLYSRHPALVAQKRIAQTVTPEEFAKTLPTDTALLEYVVMQAGEGKNAIDQTVLFVVTIEGGKTAVTPYTLAVPREGLAKQIETFYTACADPRQDGREQALAMYKLLVAPAEKQLAGKKRLIICPDGPLWDVPFQALLDGKQFLLALHARGAPNRMKTAGPIRRMERLFSSQSQEIAYAYSATGMQAALQSRENAKRAKPTKTLLALASPSFGDESRFAESGRTSTDRPIERPSRPIERPSRPMTGLRAISCCRAARI